MSLAALLVLSVVAQERPSLPPTVSTSQPVIRSTSSILQSSPLGVAELARSSNNRALKGVFSPNELRRVAPLSGRGAPQSPRKSGSADVPSGFGPQTLPGGSGFKLFQTESEEKLPTLYFGEYASNEPASTMAQSGYCKGAGKVTATVTGKGFSLKLIRTTEWIDTPSGGTEKVVEAPGNSFQGKVGMHYTVIVEFSPSAGTGIQQGMLTITEPTRTLKVPLMAESFQKELLVKIDKVSANASSYLPGTKFQATVVLDIQQNAPTQLFLAKAEPGKIKVDPKAVFATKVGKSVQKLDLQLGDEVPESEQFPVTIGVYDGGSGKLLASRILNIKVKREWVEWNYKQKAGKQTIWGKLQLANTGEFIWQVEAHNSSSVYPDRFYHGACLPKMGKNGSGPGHHMQWSLPGKGDRLIWLASGKMEITSWEAARTSVLSIFLGLWNGNPWFSQQVELADAAMNLTGMGNIGAEGLESKATVEQLNWLKTNKFVPSPKPSIKAWYVK